MTPYLGDPNATQAPSGPPAPEGAPTVNLPDDGDPPNAATFIQAYKVLADFIAFLLDMFAIVGNWTQPIQRWRNALLQDRAAIDHLGFPGGRIVQWQEAWGGVDNVVATALGSLTGTTQYWNAYLNNVGGAGAITTIDPSSVHGRRGLRMTLGQDSTDYCIVFAQAHGAFLVGTAVAVDFDYRPDLTITQMHVSAGLTQPLVGDARTPANTMVGGVFYRAAADANWQCVCSDGTTLGTPIDTGVVFAIATVYRMRVEWVGSGVADDTASAMRFYIDDNLVGTFTAHIPAASQVCGPIFTITRDSGSSARDVEIGPVRFSTNT